MDILNIFTSFLPSAVIWDWISHPFVFLYLGPESILPLASIIAAVVGVLLIFWRYIVGFFRKSVNFIRGKSPEEPVSESEVETEAAAQDIDDWINEPTDDI